RLLHGRTERHDRFDWDGHPAVTRCTVGCWAAALTIGAAVLCLALPTPVAAQTKPKPQRSLSTQLAEQRREIEKQRGQIEEQKVGSEEQVAHADSQAVRIDSLTAKLQILEIQIAALNERLADVERGAGRAIPDSLIEQRLQRIEAASKKAPELPP